MRTQPAIEVLGLGKTYPMGDRELHVLKDVSFAVGAGELVGIVGASGSGKSTLLHILGTLDTPSTGSVRIAGRDPFLGGDRQVSLFRNQEVGFVFQHNNLLAEFTALENVMMPALIAGAPNKRVLERAAELLGRVGLAERMEHYPGQLSGGEQQRVAIARALINAPTVLLADEPSGNLDSQNAEKIHRLFREVNEFLQTTILIVTHNMEFAATLGRCVRLRDGEIVSDTESIR